MGITTDKIFVVKQAYGFGDMGTKELQAFAVSEVAYQLQSLEAAWISTEARPAEGEETPDEFCNVLISLERLSFRLNEIIRCVERWKAPKILGYVCRELSDLVNEKILFQARFTLEESEHISVLVTVLCSYFQEDFVDLLDPRLDHVAKSLKTAMQPILER